MRAFIHSISEATVRGSKGAFANQCQRRFALFGSGYAGLGSGSWDQSKFHTHRDRLGIDRYRPAIRKTAAWKNAGRRALKRKA